MPATSPIRRDGCHHGLALACPRLAAFASTRAPQPRRADRRAGALAAAVAAAAAAGAPREEDGGRDARARPRDRRRAARAPAERQPRGAHGRGAARRRAGDGGGRGARDQRARRCAAAGCARWSRRRCSTPPARCARRSSTSRGWSSATRRARGCCCTARPTRAAASASPITRSAPTPAAGPRPAAGESDAVAHYPATEGVSSTQILTLVHGASAARSADVVEALSAATRVARAPARSCERAGGDALPAPARRPRGGPPPAGLRGAAADAARVPAPPRARAGRARARPCSPIATRSARAGSSEGLPFALTGDQRRAIDEIAATSRRRRRCSGC